MNGIHDMGGMHGLGSIEIETDEPVFHSAWEARVFGLYRVLNPWGRGRNWASFRFILESIPAAQYLNMSYYERWLTLLEKRSLESGFVTKQELAVGHADPALPVATMLLAPKHPPPGTRRLHLPIDPAFATEQPVRVRQLNPLGHIRLPRYTRGKIGTVISDNGIYALQDTDEHGQLSGDFPQHVYTVRFTAQELWGEAAHPNDRVCVDLWESYLEPA